MYTPYVLENILFLENFCPVLMWPMGHGPYVVKFKSYDCQIQLLTLFLYYIIANNKKTMKKSSALQHVYLLY